MWRRIRGMLWGSGDRENGKAGDENQRVTGTAVGNPVLSVSLCQSPSPPPPPPPPPRGLSPQYVCPSCPHNRVRSHALQPPNAVTAANPGNPGRIMKTCLTNIQGRHRPGGGGGGGGGAPVGWQKSAGGPPLVRRSGSVRIRALLALQRHTTAPRRQLHPVSVVRGEGVVRTTADPLLAPPPQSFLLAAVTRAEETGRDT